MTVAGAPSARGQIIGRINGNADQFETQLHNDLVGLPATTVYDRQPDEGERRCPMPLDTLLERLGVQRPLVTFALPRRDRSLSKLPRKPHLSLGEISLRENPAKLTQDLGILSILALPLALRSLSGHQPMLRRAPRRSPSALGILVIATGEFR